MGDYNIKADEQMQGNDEAALAGTITGEATSYVSNTTPGQLQIIKRNGSVVSYDESKIAIAITKAFLAVEGGNAAASARVRQISSELASKVTERLLKRGGAVHVEDVQDQVEIALGRTGIQPVFQAYILYRAEHQKAREQKATEPKENAINVTLPDGSVQPLDEKQMNTLVKEACQGLDTVDDTIITEETRRNIFDGIALTDLHKALIMSARTLIEKEPDYTYVSARLLLNTIYHEGLSFLGFTPATSLNELMQNYEHSFATYIKRGIELELLSPQLADFDLARLAKAIQPARDFSFTYLGLQTLYDRYFMHSDDTRFELPQAFFMRVAMGLAIEETGDREARVIEFYNLLSSFDYVSSTPTLFNSGTPRSQLSSCFLTTVPDDLDGIYSALNDNALLSKYAGGLGNDWTAVRAMGARIKGTNGKSQGIVPFLNVADATAIAVNQGGKRKGAVCAYLETWHMDIEEFLELRKNTGDDRRRTHDMNTANWVPDLFMQRVFEDGDWTLFSPDETPDLHDLYGDEFKKAYETYEKRVIKGEIRGKTIKAVSLWRKMLAMLFETGHPWVTFKDVCNLRSPQQHVGVVHSSNLCTEITLNTSKDEIAVCNLGSINLVQHIKDDGTLDTEKLKRTTQTAIRMLDNVIDINYYSVPQAKNSNLQHRPIGLGLMGFQDALHKQKMAYSSDEAVEFADRCMENISFYAIDASIELAKERGAYKTYEGSLWSQGILPIDSIKLLEKTRGHYLEQDTSQTLDWDALRNKLKSNGIRNSNVMAIAPTATISNIVGISQSIEPTYQNLYVKSNLSGEFTVTNKYLVNELKELGIWDDVMINDLKYFDGSVQAIDRIPNEVKHRYRTAFEVEPKWLVDAASRRQKWIDQAQSLNLYMAEPSGKKLDILYRMAWIRGLKTTYYLRSLGATSAEKSTVTKGKLNAVDVATPKACAIDDPDCEACQ